MYQSDFPEGEYTEKGRTFHTALVFVIAATMFSIHADVHSTLKEEIMNFPESVERVAATPPIQTRQSFQFQGSDSARKLQDFFERFIADRMLSFSFEEMTKWNNFVLQTARAAPSYRYEYAVETPTAGGTQYSLKVFSGEQEMATLENFNPVADTVDVHVFLGMHMRVRNIPFNNVPDILAELEKAREKCRQPFGKIRKMRDPFIRIAGCLTGITRTLSKYGIVETEQ